MYTVKLLCWERRTWMHFKLTYSWFFFICKIWNYILDRKCSVSVSQYPPLLSWLVTVWSMKLFISIIQLMNVSLIVRNHTHSFYTDIYIYIYNTVYFYSMCSMKIPDSLYLQVNFLKSLSPLFTLLLSLLLGVNSSFFFCQLSALLVQTFQNAWRVHCQLQILKSTW